MTIGDILKEKGISRYRLSKNSEIPWATLSDICSGKTSIAKCSVATLKKLALGLDMSLEEISNLKDGNDSFNQSGKPKDRTYLEYNLSAHLSKAISDYVRGQNEEVSYLDCLWGELYGSINSDLWSGLISEEQASYLRNKYL